jgi:hypothetical protein
MPIKSKPIIIPEIILDKMWVTEFSAIAPEVGGKAWLRAGLIPYNDQGQTGPVVPLDSIDIYHEIEMIDNPEDPEGPQVPRDHDAAVIFYLILKYLEKKAVEQGKLQEPDPEPIEGEGNGT